MNHTDTIPVTVEAVTEPPAASDHTAKALRAVGVELDVVGEEMTRLAAGVETLAEMGDADHQILRRIDFNVTQILKTLGPLADRVSVLEQWRGDHERAHARQ